MREFLFLEMEVAFPSQKKTLQKKWTCCCSTNRKAEKHQWTYIWLYLKVDYQSTNWFWKLKLFHWRISKTSSDDNQVYYCCDPKLIRITKKFQKFRPNSTKSKSLCWSVHCIKFLSIMIIGLLVNNFEYWKWQRSTKLFNLFISSCRKITKRFELLWTSLRKTKCIVGTPDKREMTQSL
jgi:hypothetical protein